MKTYKVIFTVFTALILGGFVLAGCSNEESGTYDNLKQRPVNSYELSKDSNFIIIANEVYDFNDFLTSKIQEKALIIEDINIELTNIQELSYEEQLVKIDEIFKSNVSERLVEHMEVFNDNWRMLKSNYIDIEDDSNVIEDALMEAIIDNTVIVSNGGCGWRYNLCIVAAGAAAVLCHGGCNTTALATTAGLGIPVCVLACGTLQVYASVQCVDTYC